MKVSRSKEGMGEIIKIYKVISNISLVKLDFDKNQTLESNLRSLIISQKCL